MSFEDKVVLVTGSGSGMGEATAILFAKEGANVVIVDCNEETANKTANKCKEYGKGVLVVKTDVSKIEDLKNAIEKTINEFGNLDVLINNAGMVREGKILPGTIMDTYEEVMNTNLRAVVAMTSLAAPYLVKTKGCIINTSSTASLSAKVGCVFPVYTLAKAGIDSFTRISALELASSGIRVNAISPGPVNTNIAVNSGVDHDPKEFAKATALQKSSEPQEIADLMLYLASDKAKSITGTIVVIDNGIILM